MLDSQLLKLTKKASFVNKQGFLTDLDISSHNSSNNSNSTTPRSERSEATGLSSARGGAATFLTRLKGSAGQLEAHHNRSHSGEAATGDAAEKVKSKTISGTNNNKSAKDFITDNIKAVQAPHKLEEEQEFRVKMMMDCSEEEFERLLAYPSFEDDMNRIDQQLAQFRRLHRLEDDAENMGDNSNVAKVGGGTGENVAKASQKGKKKPTNEIELERVRRHREAHEKAIDIQLMNCRQVMLLYVDFVAF
jgi:hypothetical protein